MFQSDWCNPSVGSRGVLAEADCGETRPRETAGSRGGKRERHPEGPGAPAKPGRGTGSGAYRIRPFSDLCFLGWNLFRGIETARWAPPVLSAQI